MMQASRKGPKYQTGAYVRILLRTADGRWNRDYLKDPQYAKHDGERGRVVDFVCLDDNQCLYRLRVSDDTELSGIPEDCLRTL